MEIKPQDFRGSLAAMPLQAMIREEQEQNSRYSEEHWKWYCARADRLERTIFGTLALASEMVAASYLYSGLTLNNPKDYLDAGIVGLFGLFSGATSYSAHRSLRKTSQKPAVSN
ncbi:MAG: hypothetical protein WCK29_00935 [archaeon]